MGRNFCKVNTRFKPKFKYLVPPLLKGTFSRKPLDEEFELGLSLIWEDPLCGFSPVSMVYLELCSSPIWMDCTQGLSCFSYALGPSVSVAIQGRTMFLGSFRNQSLKHVFLSVVSTHKKLDQH